MEKINDPLQNDFGTLSQKTGLNITSIQVELKRDLAELTLSSSREKLTSNREESIDHYSDGKQFKNMNGSEQYQEKCGAHSSQLTSLGVIPGLPRDLPPSVPYDSL